MNYEYESIRIEHFIFAEYLNVGLNQSKENEKSK